MVIQNEKIVRVYSSEEMLAVFSEKKSKKEQKKAKYLKIWQPKMYKI